MKMSRVLGILLVVALVVLIVLVFFTTPNYAPRMSGESAKLPCLANNHCPMGQKCSDGFCSEGFTSLDIPSTDMSSCTAKECKGLNAPCTRKGVPCPEGTFCQNDVCIDIAAPNQGEAYGQIGMLL